MWLLGDRSVLPYHTQGTLKVILVTHDLLHFAFSIPITLPRIMASGCAQHREISQEHKQSTDNVCLNDKSRNTVKPFSICTENEILRLRRLDVLSQCRKSNYQPLCCSFSVSSRSTCWKLNPQDNGRGNGATRSIPPS